MKCPKCGGDKFYAVQKIKSYDTVVVNENGDYIDENISQFSHPDEDSCFDYNKPEGPYFCVKCLTKIEDD